MKNGNLIWNKLVFICALLVISQSCIAQPAVNSSKYFEFHNNYWINLHHFLYQRAKGSQQAQLMEDGYDFREIGEDTIILNSNERDLMANAIAYYKNNLIDKDLRRDLGGIRVWLQQQSPNEMIKDTLFSGDFINILNDASIVYRKHFWKLHQALNVAIINEHIEVIRSLEQKVIRKMEKLAMYSWPNVDKVRIDLTAYANYAGAYTATNPTMNVVISSIDPLNYTTSLVETVFHEGSHLLFNYQDSPFRGEIYYKAKEMEMYFPRHLWHASLFYLCGRVTQDELKTLSINHDLDMDVRKIYTSFNTVEFRKILEEYYQGNDDWGKTVLALLTNIKSN